MDHKEVKIGNENFKNWLRTLDPQTRVTRISDVGRTLYKMGLGGSEIKAALAQLSQRCQVMLVKLTENEIKHHTRRRPLKRLQHSNPKTSLSQNGGNNNTLVTPNSLKEDKLFQNRNNCKFPPAYDDSKRHEYESSKASLIYHKSDSKKHDSRRPKSMDIPRKRQKKKELIRELFGEDDTEDASNNDTRTQESDQYASNMEVNLSTTVNLNYFINATPNNCLASNSSNPKRTSYSENSSQKSTNMPHKKLRIDVSLSDKNISDVKKNQLVSVIESKEGSYLDGIQISDRKKSAHKHSKRKSSGKKKSKKDRQKSSKLAPTTNTISEEDPSIKELWSILGMESPTDRTAKFLSNQCSLSYSETITLHGAPETIASENPVDVPHLSTETPSTLVYKTQCESTAEIVEPFLKISEPFSLAIVNSKEFNDICSTNGTNEQSKVISEKIVSIIGSESRGDIESNEEGVKNIACSIPENAIETIYLEEDVNDEDGMIANPKPISKQLNQGNGQNNYLEEECSKVGTIRVKSMGLLVDPQLQPTNNENVLTTEKVAQSSTDVLHNAELSNQDNGSVNTADRSVDERFFATYAYYFDELVETKIPKLGELLHLALADAMRLTERAKRADQLSSEDLIKEEKLRAEKDFIEMMKIRGVEFSPLCDIIVKRFDKGSKITLFLALFWRILKHSGTIDPANEGYILEAGKVIGLMLKRHQFKDKDILEKLDNGDEDFEEQVNTVGDLVAKCVRRNDNTTTSTITCNNSRNNVTCNSPTTSQNSQGQGSTNYAFRITEDSYKLIQKMLSDTGRSSNSNQGQDKSFTLLNENLNGREKSTLQKNTAKNNTAVNNPENLIPCRTQQPLMPQQTKITPNKIVNQGIPQNYNSTSTTDLINRFQTALAKQNVSMVNTVNNPRTFIMGNNVSTEPRVQSAVIQNTNIRPDQNQNHILKSQPSLPAKSNETPVKRNLSIGQQKQSHTFIAPRPPLRTNGIPTQAATTSSPVFRAPPTPKIFLKPPQTATPKIFLKPPQTATSSSPVNRTSTVNGWYHNISVLTSASAVGSANTTNTSAPPQYVNTSVQQPSTIKSALPHPRLSSSALPGTGDILVGHQQRADAPNRPELQRPRLDQVNTAVQIIDRNVVDPANPAIAGMNPNQLRVNTLNKGNITKKRSELIGADGSAIPPITTTSLTAGSSPRAPSSPEVTSPTAEVNLPSSSHCHPFIARRPISGKMRMFFGNNSNN